MARPSTTVKVSSRHQLDYALRRRIAEGCGGWIRSSSSDGEHAEVWFEDVEYIFEGEGLIEFLYAVKDHNVDCLYAAKDLTEYIAKSATQPPSVFVRDAIVHRAAEFAAKAFGESSP